MRAAGFVLVGGTSSRMGRDKALLGSSSGLLISQIASKVEDAAGSVTLIGEPERYRHLGLDCLPDLRNAMGPLAGIETALRSERAESNLIVACDMPGVETDWLRRLLHKAEEGSDLCVALRDGAEILHPLCAVYRSRCLPAVQKALDAGRLRLMDLLDDVAAVSVRIGVPVWNINTPGQWAAWQDRESR